MSINCLPGVSRKKWQGHKTCHTEFRPSWYLVATGTVTTIGSNKVERVGIISFKSSGINKSQFVNSYKLVCIHWESPHVPRGVAFTNSGSSPQRESHFLFPCLKPCSLFHLRLCSFGLMTTAAGGPIWIPTITRESSFWVTASSIALYVIGLMQLMCCFFISEGSPFVDSSHVFWSYQQDGTTVSADIFRDLSDLCTLL